MTRSCSVHGPHGAGHRPGSRPTPYAPPVRQAAAAAGGGGGQTGASRQPAAARAGADGKPSFVGEWRCQFYNMLEKRLPNGELLLPARTIIPPEPFPVTIYETAQGRLEGYYPNPPGIGFAGLYGNVSDDGRVWDGVFFPAPEPVGLVSGLFLFVLSEDGQEFYGAWSGEDDRGVYPGGAPQPWWAKRVG